MPNKFSLAIVITILTILAAGCSSPTPAMTTDIPTQPPATSTAPPTPDALVLKDANGRSVTLAGPARRIVSIVPSNTEILFALGAGGQVVGRDMFSDYPEEAKQVTDLGGGFGQLDMEKLVSLQPDLVLAGQITAAEQIQALEDLGQAVFVTGNPLEMEDLYPLLESVGTLTGHEPEARSLVSDLKKRVAAVDEKLAGVKDRPLVFYELDITDPNAPYTSGAGTFIDKLIQRAGGENVGSVLDTAWAQISLEELIAQDPDLIILGDYTWGGVTPENVKARAGWEALTAVKEDQVFTIDDNLISRPGPRMVDGLEEMARLLHPDLFP